MTVTDRGPFLTTLVDNRSRYMGLALILLVGFSILSPSFLDNAGTGEGNLGRQVGYTLILLLTVFCIIPKPNILALDVVPNNVLLVIALCWLSLVWSINPDIAVRRLILLTIVTWNVFISVRQLGFARTIDALRNILLFVMLLNYAAVFLWPSIGIHQLDEPLDTGLAGNWRGVLPEKNMAGGECVILLIVLIFGNIGRSARLNFLLIPLTAFFLWKTGSKTGLGTAVAAVAGGAIFTYYRPAYRLEFILGFVVGSAAIAVLGYVYWDVISAQLYREDTFTGRSQIWLALISFVNDNWLLGSGFGSFWSIGPESPINIYAQNQSWVGTVDSAHNGFLELALQLGVPASIVVVVALWLVPFSRLLGDWTISSERRAFIAASLIFCVGQNFTEATMLNRNSVTHVFWMIAIALGSSALVTREDIAGNSSVTPDHTFL